MAHSAAILGVLKAIMKHPAPRCPLAVLLQDDYVAWIMFMVQLRLRTLSNLRIIHAAIGNHSTGLS